MPGVEASTIKAEIPLAPLMDELVRAITVNVPALGAFVIKRFVPLIIYPFPFFTAVVLTAAASEPTSGSVKQKEPIISPEAYFGK